MVWIVAALLVVVLAVLILLPTGPEGRDREVPQSETPTPRTDPDQAGTDDQAEAMEAATAEDTDEIHAEQDAQPGETQPGDQPAETQAERGQHAADRAYCIIAGSFRHMANAIELQDQLKARGYPAEVMQTENRMYRVIVSAHDSKREAEQKLKQIRSQSGMENVWLLANE